MYNARPVHFYSIGWRPGETVTYDMKIIHLEWRPTPQALRTEHLWPVAELEHTTQETTSNISD